jgi:thiosulfate/3-mercaptopyruvate sulfurtransferase
VVRLVAADWVAERLGRPDLLLLDPRLSMRYLQGHLPGAVSVPLPKAFGPDGALLPPPALAAWLGDAGLSDGVTPLVYDGHDGQRGAMLVWLLEYLGRADVCLLDVYYDAWRAAGRPVQYRAAAVPPAGFAVRLNPAIRADADAVQRGDDALLDVRSREEYEGDPDVDRRPGHIPGARHLDWRALAGPSKEGSYLAPREPLATALAARGIGPGRAVITYCRAGPRAALAYLALQQLGHPVRLFDGSYAAWAAAGQPVETGPV